MSLYKFFAPVSMIFLSGCAGTNFAELNQKISDFGLSITQGSASVDSEMPRLAPAIGEKRNDRQYEITTLVDVDTAAARVRHFYNFLSKDELDSLKNSGNTQDKWTLSSIKASGYTWESTPGSYYNMGKNWNDNDHLNIKLEKNGKGTLMFITYSSANSEHLTDSYLKRLFKQINDVAVGKVR
ncbi:hypothetical protein KKI90_01500 [Xenorhabdus bovienii]|uniref:hypothetical protein n=1 Tax=Xenorhabdus bovienii TaxID=40576 RepID=UPI00237C5EBB|nr:hypothetical protein [Xenorhabdus bovienii]MDE1485128.1 hypothetical protein [Xenorhabdus bovienii]MDE9475991.1 hypothetical protein [Xenorhabdus bovienii]MDE9528760.1 hypothetical protein [Xenorhabdus bovienii]